MEGLLSRAIRWHSVFMSASNRHHEPLTVRLSNIAEGFVRRLPAPFKESGTLPHTP